ncbi:MAG: hypothetical protein LBQ84_09855 [Flavobacteriaceae bacterium]|jgi:hypothetical protein|nr:hypothetical protein [Flavobacteriaceae bacterium]
MRWYMFLLLCFIETAIYSQTDRDFILLDKFDESDFNYNLIDSINNYIGKENLLNNVFNVRKGDYTVYRFLRQRNGESKKGDVNSVGSELIIVKIHPQSNKVIEAIYFPLDWKELPLSDVLVKSHPNIKLRKRILIKRMKLGRIDSDSGWVYL